jgi:hypothetical protein
MKYINITPRLLPMISFNSNALFGTKMWANSKNIERVNKKKKLLINFLLFKLQINPKKDKKEK